MNAVEQLKASFPEVPIYACARDMRHAILLEKAGADTTTVEINQNALAMSKQVLQRVGGPRKWDTEMNGLADQLLKDVESRGREVDWESDGTPLDSRNSDLDLYVYGGASQLLLAKDVDKEYVSDAVSDAMTAGVTEEKGGRQRRRPGQRNPPPLTGAKRQDGDGVQMNDDPCFHVVRSL
eukprot:CAMPEP_0170172338 /NCGR_PEP_ID=MMETSP0040_2-20121228/5568_1 /TAXON_ID=641309 /ORGANISM="Lotharella oceanica, Strain CCMP622" /LENGTH=179 /DNA_ID=CAMNT_0010412945 /DNA_START=39 /DNA_END=579 /DNA_ORIENTATION=-